jgi:hypothetical protein
MIIKSAYEPINRLIRFIDYNSDSVDVWFYGFGYTDNFEYALLDLLANCNKIGNVDYSKFIVYIMLSKFCPSTDMLILPSISYPDSLETNYLQNLIIPLVYYKKRVTIDMETSDLETYSNRSVVVENNLIANTFLNLILEQDYKYRPQVVFVNSFAYYLCLLF